MTATTKQQGKHSNLLVLSASLGQNLGNFLFYLIAARMVAPADFAAISVLVAFSQIAIMPLNGVQVAVARDVAVLGESDTAGALSAYLRRLAGRMGIVSGAVLLLIGGLSTVLADRLHIGSAVTVVLAAVWIAGMTLLVVLTGVTQGMQRFGYVSFVLAGPLGLFRPLLLPLGIVIAGVLGSMWAMIVATVIGLAVMVRPVGPHMRVAPTKPPPMPSTAVTVVALLAFSSLTVADLLTAQASLDAIGRAHYASAALLGKIALYAPAALALVMLPRATVALERGERADGVVLRTIGLTAVCGLLVAGVLWAMPTSVLTKTFGPAYAAAKPLLGPLALVMTGVAVLWVHLMFATAKRSRRMTVGLVVAAVAHWILLLLLHNSPQQIIMASAIAIGGSLIVIELGSSGGIVRMLMNRPKPVVDPPALADG